MSRRLFSPRLVSLVCKVSLCSWACCVLGFLGQTPSVVLALSTLYLFAVACTVHGVGHRWYAPVYAFLFLALSSTNHSYAIDAWLSSVFPNYPFAPSSSSVLLSGIGRKLAFLGCLFTLFGGACSKMIRSGVKWMDGHSLAYYTQINTHGRFTGYLPFMKQLLCDYIAISMTLSVKTIAFQFLSVVALFYAGIRPMYVFVAWGFHIGTYR